MAEVLTQNQIDELVLSIMKNNKESGDVENSNHKQWKAYDFNSPKRFKRDKFRLLRSVYDNYGRIASFQLNGLLRTSCEVEVESLDEGRYSEFFGLLSENDIMMKMNVRLADKSQPKPILFHMEPNLMVNMIDRLLGGMEVDDEVDSSYSYTEIETALYKEIADLLLGITDETWSNYVDLKLSDRILEEDPELFKEISMDESVALITLSIKMQDVKGKFTFCVTGSFLTSIFESIDKKKIKAIIKEKEVSCRDQIMEQLTKTKLEVRAELGEAVISLQDIYDLQVGDVIDLNKSKDSEILIYVENQPWFIGEMGIHNKNMAVKIDRNVSEEPTDVYKMREG